MYAEHTDYYHKSDLDVCSYLVVDILDKFRVAEVPSDPLYIPLALNRCPTGLAGMAAVLVVAAVAVIVVMLAELVVGVTEMAVFRLDAEIQV